MLGNYEEVSVKSVALSISNLTFWSLAESKLLRLDLGDGLGLGAQGVGEGGGSLIEESCRKWGRSLGRGLIGDALFPVTSGLSISVQHS